jgi:hypothetical protein
VVWLIGGACLIVGQLIGWWMGYGRGKKDALREVGRIEEYNRRRKITARVQLAGVVLFADVYWGGTAV